ncbi:hypothetical protein QTN25_007034 [Entamoeba marina]
MKRKSFQSNKIHLRDGCIETLDVIDILNKLSEVELCLKNLYIMNNEQLNLIADTRLVTSDKNDIQRIVNVIISLKNQIENQTNNQFGISDDDNSSSNSSTTQLFNTTKDINEMDSSDSDDEIQLFITYSDESNLNLSEETEEKVSKSHIEIKERDKRTKPKYSDINFGVNNLKMNKLLNDMFGTNENNSKQKQEYKIKMQTLLKQFLSSSENRNAKSLRDQVCNLVDYFKNNSNFCEYHHLECLSPLHHFTKSFIEKQVLLKAETTSNKPDPHKRQLILDYSERDILAEEIKNTLKKQNDLNYNELQQFVKSSFNKDVTKVWLYDFVSRKKLRHTNSNSTKY